MPGGGASRVVGLVRAVQFVLPSNVSIIEFSCLFVSSRLRQCPRIDTHVVVVGAAHFETAVTAGADSGIVVTGNVGKGIATLPLATISSRVSLQSV